MTMCGTPPPKKRVSTAFPLSPQRVISKTPVTPERADREWIQDVLRVEKIKGGRGGRTQGDGDGPDSCPLGNLVAAPDVLARRSQGSLFRDVRERAWRAGQR